MASMEARKKRATALSERRKRERDMQEGKNLETQISKLADREERARPSYSELLAPVATVPPPFPNLSNIVPRPPNKEPETSEAGEGEKEEREKAVRTPSRGSAGSKKGSNPLIVVNAKSPEHDDDSAGGRKSAGEGGEGQARPWARWPTPADVLGYSTDVEGAGGFTNMVNKMVKMRRKESKMNLATDDHFTSVVLDMIRGKTPTVPDKPKADIVNEPKPEAIEVPSAESPVPAPTISTPVEDQQVRKAIVDDTPKRTRMSRVALKMTLFLSRHESVHSPDAAAAPSEPSLLRYLDDDYIYDDDDPHNYKKDLVRELTMEEERRLAQQEADRAEEAKLAVLRAKAKLKRQVQRAEKKEKEKEKKEGEEEGSEEELIEDDFTSTSSSDSYDRIEEKISIDTLESLKTAFHTADVDGTGKLELDEFKTLLKNHLNLATSKEGQIDLLFQKIDWSSEGAITWDEFCTYMQLEYAEKEDSYLRAKEVAFGLPAKIENMPHREPVLRITDTHDGVFIACSQDGLVTFWSGQLDHKRTRTVVTAEQSSRTKPKWITDFCLMPQYNKLIVGTGDREIQFFELSSFEPYCQISGLETVPLKLDYCSTGHDECMIMFGDSQGCINILVIGSAGECLRMWKKAPKAEGIASVSIDVIAKGSSTEFIRWKVHGDWVQQLKYYHNIRQVISCSNHSNTALVIGCTMGSTHVEQQLKEIKDPSQLTGANKSKQTYQFGQPKTRLAADQSVFKVYKGVKCFDFSKHKNIIITGGMDRIVRLWNPYVPLKPTGMLRGHSAPIFYLFIAEEENRIFSISTDLCIKIWDIQDQNCLLTVRPKGHKIRGDLQACHYSNVSKALAIATDQMNGLSLKLKPALHADVVITHKDPIQTCVYNPAFKQVITASEGSVIKIWDFETGSLIFEYGEAHGEHAITCMTFDNTERRLITGGRDGCIRIWNYNNGHCLKTMMKEKDNEEICDISYVEMNKNRYVVAVGWDKRINIYSDATDAGVHHIQHPLAKWADDINNGHQEDILSVAQCPPNLLATSGYDGVAIVWNMVSGHIFCHLNPPTPQGYEDQSLDGDLSINKLLFIKSRAYNKEAGTLIASGPRAHIHFWNVFSGGAMLAQFPGSRMPGAMVTAMAIVDNDTMLFSADNMGFIYQWNIDGYCIKGEEQESPELMRTWRGHVESVTDIVLVQETRTILTTSTDCTVRVWSFDGEYVGTFGQSDTWDIYNSGTFQHPMVPYDVLVDPNSLPDHPVLQDKQNVHQVVHEDSARNSDDDEKIERWTPTQYGKNTVYVGDEEIAEEVRKLAPTLRGKDMKNKGKRLRHEQKKPIRIDRGGPSEYRMLTCYSLDPTPALAEPKFKTDKDNQFDFFPTL